MSTRSSNDIRDDKEAGTIDFGFQTVSTGDKQKLVGDVFHNVATSYDVMNDLMSGTLHRLWKDQFVSMLEPLPADEFPSTVLDVAGGTGDIAFRILEAMRKNSVVPGLDGGVRESNKSADLPDGFFRPGVIVSDINASMLQVGEDRAFKRGYPKYSLPFCEDVAQGERHQKKSG